MNPGERQLADVASNNIVSVPETASVADTRAAAAGREWVVVTDAGSRPVRVIAPAELEHAHATCAITSVGGGPVFVLPSRLPIDFVRRTRQVKRNASGLLRIRGIVIYDVHPTRPVGVWAGPSLSHYLLQLSPSRTYDPTLPGSINIPLVQHKCAFAEAALISEFLQEFDELPDDMPQCGNPKHMTAHTLTW